MSQLEPIYEKTMALMSGRPDSIPQRFTSDEQYNPRPGVHPSWGVQRHRRYYYRDGQILYPRVNWTVEGLFVPDIETVRCSGHSGPLMKHPGKKIPGVHEKISHPSEDKFANGRESKHTWRRFFLAH